MTAEFLKRIRKEFTLTLRGAHETVLAIAERVNRKVQVLKLHWQAASLCEEIETRQEALGLRLVELLAQPDDQAVRPDAQQMAGLLMQTTSDIRLLKKELLQLDPQVRQIESEALREDLLNLERDLFLRAATIERLNVGQGAAAVGQAVSQLGLPSTVRVIALFRGASLLLNFDAVAFCPGDAVILLGDRDDLKAVLPLFLERKGPTA